MLAWDALKKSNIARTKESAASIKFSLFSEKVGTIIIILIYVRLRVCLRVRVLDAEISIGFT